MCIMQYIFSSFIVHNLLTKKKKKNYIPIYVLQSFSQTHGKSIEKSKDIPNKPVTFSRYSYLFNSKVLLFIFYNFWFFYTFEKNAVVNLKNKQFKLHTWRCNFYSIDFRETINNSFVRLFKNCWFQIMY